MKSLSELLAELVQIPSVNPMGRSDIPSQLCFESRVADRIEYWLQELGVQVTRQSVLAGRDNLYARYDPPTPASVCILFEAHQDTVPVDGMTIDPFGGSIQNGKLFGRGACDVKAGIVAMFGTFRRLVMERPAKSASVILALTIDEEHTFLGVQHLVKAGLKADFAVVAEPTRLNIVQAHKGVVRWYLETAGTACHSSTPNRGVNAVYRMAKVLTAIEQYAKQLESGYSDPLLGTATLSVGMVQGGVSPNTVPDLCRIQLDRRLLPGESATGVIEDLNRFLKSRPEIDFPVDAQLTFACPSLAPNKNCAWVGQLGNAIDSVAGSHELIAVPFGTDASTIQEAGIPAVVFGPGDIAQAHTRDEWIELKQVEQASEILWQFATKYTG
jgi:acetylornithine deacetylase/succinyl-diaminopimelate desuccinylase family protein